LFFLNRKILHKLKLQ